MERAETPVLWRKPPVTEHPRSCGRRASALLCKSIYLEIRSSERLVSVIAVDIQ
jgi:hypothetical protein